MGDLFCETCLERGRQRLADVVNEDLQMCRDCFDGKPTCKTEEIGGADGDQVQKQLDYQRRNAEHVRKVRAAWRARNRERLRDYGRGYYRAAKEQATEGVKET